MLDHAEVMENSRPGATIEIKLFAHIQQALLFLMKFRLNAIFHIALIFSSRAVFSTKKTAFDHYKTKTAEQNILPRLLRLG